MVNFVVRRKSKKIKYNELASHYRFKKKILLRHYFKATRAFPETDDWVGQDVCIDVFLRALTFKYMSESSKKKTWNNFFTPSEEESLLPVDKKVEKPHKKVRFRKKLRVDRWDVKALIF